MIALTLQPMNLKTRFDVTETMATCEKVVNHGGPLSPVLYNVYMDTFAKGEEVAIGKTPRGTREGDTGRGAICQRSETTSRHKWETTGIAGWGN